MIKKKILFSLGITSFVVIGVAAGISCNEKTLLNANADNQYGLEFTADNFKNAKISTKNGNVIPLEYHGGGLLTQEGALAKIPAGASFTNKAKITGINKIYATFDGEMSIDLGFDTTLGETVTQRVDAHKNTTLTSAKDFFFVNNENPSFITFNAKKDTILKSLYIQYSCSEDVLAERYAHTWYIAGNMNGVNSFDDASKRIKMEFDPQENTTITQYKATLDLKAGDTFKITDGVNDWRGIEAINSSLVGEDKIVVSSDEVNKNIKVNKDGEYTIYFKENKDTWINFAPVLDGKTYVTVNDVKHEAVFHNENEVKVENLNVKVGDIITFTKVIGDKVETINVRTDSNAIAKDKTVVVTDKPNTIKVIKDCTLSAYIGSLGAWVEGKVNFGPSKLFVKGLNEGSKLNVELVKDPDPNKDQEMALNVKLTKDEKLEVARIADGNRIENINMKPDLLNNDLFKKYFTIDKDNVLTVTLDCTVSFYVDKDGVWISVAVEKVIRDATLYLVPNNRWNEANARFAIYLMGNDAEGTWYDLVKVENKDNIYKIDLKGTDATGFIFCRMNPNTENNNWDNMWAQTENLTFNEHNMYSIKPDSWKEGTWSTYVA